MFSSLLPDADAIDLWATQRIAEGELPRVVRRLITATTKPTWIDVGAGIAVRFPGWDGQVRVVTGNQWVPDGDSFWEIGAGGDPNAKANGDYRKRTKQTPPAVRKASTFVFVSAKNWQDRDKWQAKKKASGVWGDVRAIDAQHLEAWLEKAPVVHQRLSEKMHSRIHDVRSLDDWWQEWSDWHPNRLPRRVLLANREAQAVDLVSWVDAHAATRVIQADTQDEAIAFVAAALQSTDPDIDARFMRAVVVRTADAFRELMHVTQPLIMIPTFSDEPPWSRQAERNGHHVIIPTSPDEGLVANMSISAPDADDLVAGLEEMGLDPRRARQVVEDAGGSLRHLRRSLSGVEEFRTPPWSRGDDTATLVPALLAQSWDSASDGDQAILSRLAGRAYEDLERDLAVLAEGEDPPVRKRGSIWVLTARDDSWRLLLRSVTPDDWANFVETATDVLGAPDPSWDLPPDQRWMAAVYNKGTPHSARLRRGFSNSIAMLAGWRHARELGTQTGPAIADAIVARLLDPINDVESGARWAAIGENLPSLAEAAPERFLAAVTAGLDGENPVLVQLMVDADAGGMFGRVGYAGILWGLEALAWSPEYLEQTAKVLARWSAVDPGGRWGNRPARSFQEIFIPWHVQTSATVAERIAALAAVRAAEPEAAWALLLKLMPEGLGPTVGFTHAPRWRAWKPAKDITTTPEEYWTVVGTMLGWLLDDAGQDATRWAVLVALFPHIRNEEIADRIVGRLADLDPAVLTPAGREALAKVLRETINQHLTYSDTDWAMSRQRVATLEPLRDKLDPEDPVLRHRWLFDHHPDMESVAGRDIHTYDTALERLRLDAMRDVLSSGWGSVDRLVASAPYPFAVGWTLGALDVDETAVLAWGDSAEAAQVAALNGFVASKTRRVGWDWAEEMVRARVRDWSIDQTAQVILSASDRGPGWALAASLGPEFEAAYWHAFTGYLQGAEAWAAAAKLVEFGRPIDALDRVGWEPELATEHFDADLVFAALMAGITDTTAGPHAISSLQHNLPAILDALDRAGIDSDKVALIEWAYFPLNEHGDRPPRRLGNLLARDPEFFVQTVSTVFRREGDPAEVLDEQATRVATLSWNLLRTWRTTPGTTDDGGFDGDALTAWVHEARGLLRDAGREKVGDSRIGAVLWWAPEGSDGIRPPEAVRDLIEEVASEAMEQGFQTEGFGSRGVFSRSIGEGGRAEREIASGYMSTAAALRAQWPRTAETFARLAAAYEWLGKREDDEAALDLDDQADV